MNYCNYSLLYLVSWLYHYFSLSPWSKMSKASYTSILSGELLMLIFRYLDSGAIGNFTLASKACFNGTSCLIKKYPIFISVSNSI
jgi:hypothetical protein